MTHAQLKQAFLDACAKKIRLEAELREALKDTVRLDWLERNRYGLLPGMPKEKHDYWFIRYYDGRPSLDGSSEMRLTIDAAMQESTDGK